MFQVREMTVGICSMVEIRLMSIALCWDEFGGVGLFESNLESN